MVDANQQSGQRELAQYLIENVTKPGCVPVHEDVNERHVLVTFGNGHSDVMSYDKIRNPLLHKFHTLAGLISYLTNDHDKSKRVMVFVGPEHIKANLDYMGLSGDKIMIPLVHSPEMQSLKSLFNGLGQKDLWRELVTDLHNCVSNNLLMAVSCLSIKARRDEDMMIQVTGITNAKAAQTYQITIPDREGNPQEFQMSTDWDFVIPVFDCFPKPTTINTRLEMSVSHGLGFKFHPRRLERTIADTRLGIVDYLRDEMKALPYVSVVEGEDIS